MNDHFSTFDLVRMKELDRMPMDVIVAKTGLDADEIKHRIKEYHRGMRYYAGESYQRNHAKGKVHTNDPKHPERNSQYAEKGQ